GEREPYAAYGERSADEPTTQMGLFQPPAGLANDELQRVGRRPVEDHAGRERVKDDEEEDRHRREVSPLAADEIRREGGGFVARGRGERHAAHEEGQEVQPSTEPRQRDG